MDDDKTEDDNAWEEYSQRDWSDDDEHNMMPRKLFCLSFYFCSFLTGKCNLDWAQTLNPDDYPNSDISEPNSPTKKRKSTLKLLYEYFLLT